MLALVLMHHNKNMHVASGDDYRNVCLITKNIAQRSILDINLWHVTNISVLAMSSKYCLMSH